MITRLLAAAALAAASLSLTAADAHAGIFSPTSVWNAPLGAKAPLAPNSSTLVRGLRAQVAQGVWINSSFYSTPVYTVPGDQPRVKVTLDQDIPTLAADFASVPLPDNALPAKGSDAHLTVYQPSTDTLWEFIRLARRADGWHALWGGRMPDVSTNPGYFRGSYGATGTSLPLLGGLMRTSELRARRIDHALAIAVPDVTASTVVWPAQRTDGVGTSATSIPEGTRFRIPASVDVSRLGLSPTVAAMALAAQRYGMIVRDRAGQVVFYGEDPSPSGIDPYPSFFGTWNMREALKAFPWRKLQVVAPTAAAAAGRR
jgi:hypothetical protein